MTLRERAAERGGQSNGRPERPQQSAPAPDRVPDVADYSDPIEPDPEQVPVHIAWARVMRDVRAIAKAGEYNAAGTRYRYRGVDDVTAAVSNSIRRHGVMILPVDIDMAHRDTTTAKGNPTRECTMKVTYRVLGPMGDDLHIVGAGEALDSGDKGTTKAGSVAERNALLHALLVPTGAPEPEASGIERGHTSIPPLTYRDEIAHPDTSMARLMQVRREFRDAPQTAGAIVPTPTGDMTLADLLAHVGRARQEGRDPWPETPPAAPADGSWPETPPPGGAA